MLREGIEYRSCVKNELSRTGSIGCRASSYETNTSPYINMNEMLCKNHVLLTDLFDCGSVTSNMDAREIQFKLKQIRKLRAAAKYACGETIKKHDRRGRLGCLSYSTTESKSVSQVQSLVNLVSEAIVTKFWNDLKDEFQAKLNIFMLEHLRDKRLLYVEYTKAKEGVADQRLKIKEEQILNALEHFHEDSDYENRLDYNRNKIALKNNAKKRKEVQSMLHPTPL
eukprot:TRINITY_DN7492_c0_g1_i1.p1 TRINITY_DN7492_c0_g1~~TRINITY_DN7492_c0_g1_i1.p1  ORF type:complete len:225 (-),score=33.87 TRINITY_DN7492_c0_g1_i1:163-837(-)